ncbi:hypothetical protein CDAR_40071 [Caerostris darwini]|uniref:Uncharacterized protein n=1 Tax=Caerostris darwini TaxID=1538125 RepID=A0AAV4R763_9ARAC|nr:hypothetical protein CDAR_40071 [Caerostris darwini]
MNRIKVKGRVLFHEQSFKLHEGDDGKQKKAAAEERHFRNTSVCRRKIDTICPLVEVKGTVLFHQESFELREGDDGKQKKAAEEERLFCNISVFRRRIDIICPVVEVKGTVLFHQVSFKLREGDDGKQKKAAAEERHFGNTSAMMASRRRQQQKKGIFATPQCVEENRHNLSYRRRSERHSSLSLRSEKAEFSFIWGLFQTQESLNLHEGDDLCKQKKAAAEERHFCNTSVCRRKIDTICPLVEVKGRVLFHQESFNLREGDDGKQKKAAAVKSIAVDKYFFD